MNVPTKNLITLTNKIAANMPANKSVNEFVVDMSDVDIVRNQLSYIKPDIIIHCAGAADVGNSILYPEMDYKSNVTATHNLLFSLHNLHMENVKVVFLSSAAVYGNPISLPITEDMDLNPLSPYAVHKVMCEVMCNYFINNYGMDIKIARIFSAYGVGLKKQIFWDMHKKLFETGRLDMFGTGNESRDYIYIDDVVQVIYLLATVDSTDTYFNIANGEETTIRQITEIFAETSKVSLKNISFNGVTKEGNPINWRADIGKIQKLGYKKNIDITQGIFEYVNWVNNL